MSEAGFSADWLDLREPADHAARDAGLLAAAAQCVLPGQVILDLGSGTGSTARAFPVAGARFAWRFVDGDAGLLELAVKRHPASQKVLANLADLDQLPLDGVGLVTASALLDLMPERWIEALAAVLGAARIPLYAALTYNGDMAWTPPHPFDDGVTEAFNRHQGTDKGLGPAAGPKAALIAKRAFERQGYTVSLADSPWTLGPESHALQTQLNLGIADAAKEAGFADADIWRAARQPGSMRVGHSDLLALPPGPGRRDQNTE